MLSQHSLYSWIKLQTYNEETYDACVHKRAAPVHIVILIYVCTSKTMSTLTTFFRLVNRGEKNSAGTINAWTKTHLFPLLLVRTDTRLRITQKKSPLHLFECVMLTNLHCGVLTDSMQQRLLSDCSFFIGRELFTGEWITVSVLLSLSIT